MRDDRDHFGAHSGLVIESIFRECFPEVRSVIDLTFGQGTFWRWDWQGRGFTVTPNDLYVPLPPRMAGFRLSMAYDCQATPEPPLSYDVAVFDPPFTAQGPGAIRHNDRYGSTRDLPGAPRNIAGVRSLLAGGITEACSLAREGVIVKTQDVVESGELHANVILAMNKIVQAGFNIVATWRYLRPHRPQPPGRRDTGLGNHPSTFIVAKRWCYR